MAKKMLSLLILYFIEFVSKQNILGGFEISFAVLETNYVLM